MPVEMGEAAAKTALATKAAEILEREIRERTRATSAGTPILLDVRQGVGAEGFAIEDGPGGGVRIVGDDGRGLLYGVGRFLRGSRFSPGAFTPSPWRGRSVPAMPIRGIYFATHFHNFFHEAPLQDIRRYLEELALWGCNALVVWFDMHHYTGLDDPAAGAMVARLRAILAFASEVGIAPGLGVLANEAYSSSPVELRAMPFPWHYHVELCPSKPAGMELILKWRREMLQAFAGLDIQQVWIWPYDQGGCRCDACAPWGVNGYINTSKRVSDEVRRTFPQANIILSTWCFDYEVPGEYVGLARKFATQKPNWVDYLIVDAHIDRGFPQYVLEHGAPGGLPVLNFPEISMYGMGPWGGFGANVYPSMIQGFWDKSRHLLAGGFPYCEGIYEDLNKAVALQLYWDPQKPALETVRDYASYEFSPDTAGDVTAAVQSMEQTLGHWLVGREQLQLWQKNPHASSASDQLYRLTKLKSPPLHWEVLHKVDRELSPQARASWRWRILYLRAALDQELCASGGRPTPRADACFEELTRIYHAENADFTVAPPSRRALQRLLGK